LPPTPSEQPSPSKNALIKSGAESSAKENQELIDAMHDVREFNRVIKTNVEWITTHVQFDRIGHPVNLSAETADTIRQQLGSIFRTTQLLSTRLALIDYETDPNVLLSEATYPAKLYAKFDKARMVLLVHARQEKVNVRITGSSHRTFDVYPVLDTLPFLLLENALKYSPTGCDVTVHFEESADELRVRVTSLGPLVLPAERGRVFEKHFRGAYAAMHQPRGKGFGLYFAEVIAELHGFGLDVDCGEETMKMNGVPFGRFEVVLTA
jgi:light-regulated signal transduction histidine kinase (bacteriophytochrome)